MHRKENLGMRALISAALSSFVIPNGERDLLLASRPVALKFATLALALFFIGPSP
jgi:hypothetical protein